MSESNHYSVLIHYIIRFYEKQKMILLLEIDQNFYRNLSDFIGNLRKQEFDGVESKIKDTMIEMTTELNIIINKNQIR